jgi:hypothetical protein
MTGRDSGKGRRVGGRAVGFIVGGTTFASGGGAELRIGFEAYKLVRHRKGDGRRALETLGLSSTRVRVYVVSR